MNILPQYQWNLNSPVLWSHLYYQYWENCLHAPSDRLKPRQTPLYDQKKGFPTHVVCMHAYSCFHKQNRSTYRSASSLFGAVVCGETTRMTWDNCREGDKYSLSVNSVAKQWLIKAPVMREGQTWMSQRRDTEQNLGLFSVNQKVSDGWTFSKYAVNCNILWDKNNYIKISELFF